MKITAVTSWCPGRNEPSAVGSYKKFQPICTAQNEILSQSGTIDCLATMLFRVTEGKMKAFHERPHEVGFLYRKGLFCFIIVQDTKSSEWIVDPLQKKLQKYRYMTGIGAYPDYDLDEFCGDENIADVFLFYKETVETVFGEVFGLWGSSPRNRHSETSWTVLEGIHRSLQEGVQEYTLSFFRKGGPLYVEPVPRSPVTVLPQRRPHPLVVYSGLQKNSFFYNLLQTIVEIIEDLLWLGSGHLRIPAQLAIEDGS